MKTDSPIAYHLRELEIATHPESPRYAMPHFSVDDQAILDIGCGIGQTFVASKTVHGMYLVGVDVDTECLKYGSSRFAYINYVNAAAEQLPFNSGLFCMVVARVCLPYTNITGSLAEANRVLRTNGRVWMTLHPFSKVWLRLMRSLVHLGFKDVAYCIYLICNGPTFNLAGREFRFFANGRYESFQCIHGISRAMKKAGFADVRVHMQGGSFVCSGCKP